MADNSSEKMEGLAELLPEGLTEHAVEEIAQMVDSVITERVSGEVDGLITKVNAFLRMKVDEIKSYALKELEQDEEIVRNAQLYENMKTVMALDIGHQDHESAIHDLAAVNEDAQENISTLTKEIETLMEENEKVISVAQALNEKVEALENEKLDLVNEATALVESQRLPFESSEKAVMVSKSEETSSTEADGIQSINEFLTPEVMRFMPIAE